MMRVNLIRICSICLFFGLLTTSGRAQIIINFNAPVYGQSLDGLSFVQIINSSQEDVRTRVTIRVRETTGGNVLTAVINAALIRKGINTIDRGAYSAGRFSFGNNYYGLTVSQTGKFPEGDYEYCFEVEITDSKSTWTPAFFENCFDQQLQPMTPLLLINPADGDESCNTRPDFLWQLPMPLPVDARCRLILTEIKDKQDIAEAINYNLPVINQGNIFGNQLRFPPGAPALEQNKQYVWQVTVYTGTTILKKSEIWTYKIKCDEPVEIHNKDSYRELKQMDDGNFYVATNVLRFSLNNPYSLGALNYSIIALDNPGVVISGLPSLKLQAGLNKYDLDLSDNKSFKDGQEYLLKVKLASNRELHLKFLYKTE